MVTQNGRHVDPTSRFSRLARLLGPAIPFDRLAVRVSLRGRPSIDPLDVADVIAWLAKPVWIKTMRSKAT